MKKHLIKFTFIIRAQGSAPNGMAPRRRRAGGEASSARSAPPAPAPGRGPSILPVLIWSSFLKRAPQADWRLFMPCEYTSIFVCVCIYIYISRDDGDCEDTASVFSRMRSIKSKEILQVWFIDAARLCTRVYGDQNK